MKVNISGHLPYFPPESFNLSDNKNKHKTSST